MPKPTWLEVALNGGWTRALQPRIPVTVNEIVEAGVACVNEGAAIVHVHAYDEMNGRQCDDADTYARIIEGIRARVDAIVYPTIDAAVPRGGDLSVTGPARYSAIETLAARGLLEWCVVDPGSVNTSSFAAIGQDRPGTVYLNTDRDVRAGLALAAQHGFHPSYAVYEPGFVRLGAALARRYPGLKAPIYRFMFSDGLAFGFPPRPYGLEAYCALLAEHAPGAPWMIAGLMADLTPLLEPAIRRGGHIRAGLEDAPLGCELDNSALTAAAARAVTAAGATLATAAEVRASLAAAG